MQISFTTYAINQTLLRCFTAYDSYAYSNSQNNTPEENSFAFGETSSYNAFWSNYLTTYYSIRLMQGTVPTASTLPALLSDRVSDSLVQWQFNDTNYNTYPWVSDNNSIYLNGTALTAANASGNATWLWWYTVNGLNPDPNQAIKHQAVFTVGALGSGSDFELVNTSIVAGNGYRLVNGPRLSLATEYNY